MGSPSRIATLRGGPRPIHDGAGSLSLAALNKQAFFSLLASCDADIAAETRAACCPHCKGPLHQAGWERKPRGALGSLPAACLRRHGLCCGHCRRRTLPASCLFDGRRVYLRAAMLLVVALRQTRPGSWSMGHIARRLGVTTRTIARWQRHFAEAFAGSSAWQRLRGHIGAQVRDGHLPADLLRLLAGPEGDMLGDDVLARACRLLATGAAPPTVGICEG